MRGHSWYAIAGLTTLFACALIASGCGSSGSSTTTATTTPSAASAQQKVDSAVESCSNEAQQLGGVAGTALDGACTAVGNSAKQTLSSGSANAKQALSEAASSCRTAVGQLPPGQAQNGLSKLCDALASAQ